MSTLQEMDDVQHYPRFQEFVPLKHDLVNSSVNLGSLPLCAVDAIQGHLKSGNALLGLSRVSTLSVMYSNRKRVVKASKLHVVSMSSPDPEGVKRVLPFENQIVFLGDDPMPYRVERRSFEFDTYTRRGSNQYVHVFFLFGW